MQADILRNNSLGGARHVCKLPVLAAAVAAAAANPPGFRPGTDPVLALRRSSRQRHLGIRCQSPPICRRHTTLHRAGPRPPARHPQPNSMHSSRLPLVPSQRTLPQSQQVRSHHPRHTCLHQTHGQPTNCQHRWCNNPCHINTKESRGHTRLSALLQSTHWLSL